MLTRPDSRRGSPSPRSFRASEPERAHSGRCCAAGTRRRSSQISRHESLGFCCTLQGKVPRFSEQYNLVLRKSAALVQTPGKLDDCRHSTPLAIDWIDEKRYAFGGEGGCAFGGRIRGTSTTKRCTGRTSGGAITRGCGSLAAKALKGSPGMMPSLRYR